MKQHVTKIRIIKLHPDAVIPEQKIGDLGFDLSSIEDVVLQPLMTTKVKTGLAYASNPIACGYDGDQISLLGKIEGRSGLASKAIFPVGGIIDVKYRGDLTVCLYNGTSTSYSIKKGDRIAQMVFYPVLAKKSNHYVAFEETDVQDTTDRGNKGFGSSGD